MGGFIGCFRFEREADDISVLTALTEKQDSQLREAIRGRIVENGQPLPITYEAVPHTPPCFKLMLTPFGPWRCRECGKFASV